MVTTTGTNTNANNPPASSSSSGGGGGNQQQQQRGAGGGRGGGGGRKGGGARGGKGGGGRGKGGGGGDPQQGGNAKGDNTSNNAKAASSGGGRRRNRGRGGGGDNKNAAANKNKGNKQQQQQRKKKAGPAPKQQQQQQQQKALDNTDEAARRHQEQEHQAAAAQQQQAEKERLDREKKEQEEAAAAAAKLRQRREEQAALDDQIRQARETLQSLTDTVRQRQASREKFQAESLAACRKDFEANKKKLKTDIKKCTAFVKKIKSGTAWSMRPTDVDKDVKTLNLSRYVEEVVAAILESKPKVADLPVILALCRALHQRYAQFIPNLVPGLWTVVNTSPTTASSSAGSKTAATTTTPETAKLRRLYLRLLTEFVLSGLVTDAKPLVKCITEASGGNQVKESGSGSSGTTTTYNVQDAPLLVAFGKAASPDLLGVTPQSARDALALIERHVQLAATTSTATPPTSSDTPVAEPTSGIESAAPTNADDAAVRVSPALLRDAQTVAEACRTALSSSTTSITTTTQQKQQQQVLHQHCLGAYQTLAGTLQQTHTKLQKLEKRCETDRLLAGSLTEAREKGLADARKLKDSLQKSVEALADVLAQPVPHLAEQEEDVGPDAGLGGVEVWTSTAEGAEEDFGPFDDEETRAFYCDIPDLLTTIPPALLGIAPHDMERRKAESAQKYGTDAAAAAAAMEEEDHADVQVTPTSEAELLEQADEEQGGAISTTTGAESGDEGGKEGEEEDKDAPHYRLMVLLEQELPECHRREQIDEITERFCTTHASSKNSRKRLMKTLFLVPRSRLDLLPYYSRMAATLDRVWGEMGTGLVTELEQQFHGQTKFKKNQNIESRMRTARYIGELTKFRVAPPMVFLRCIKRCLEDFTGSNVDVACTLLESSGRFLFRLKHTSTRISDLMETMTRLSKAKNLDERLQSLIKASFYSVKPPPAGPRKRAKEYPPLEAYLRHLLMVRLSLSNSSVSFVSKQIGRLPWNDPTQQCGALVCRLMMKACRKGRYKTIQAIAMVASNIRTQRTAGEATVRLVDAVLEELRWSLEFPDFRDQQRTLTYARLLGELYCASQVPAQVVIQQLYDFVNLGHEIPEALREASQKLVSEVAAAAAAAGGDDGENNESQQPQQLPVYNSSGGVITQTIQEDEEMEDAELEATKEEDDEKAAAAAPQPVAVSEHSIYDPRVPSPQDPPNSAYRIKLVCILLEVVAKHIMSRNNLPRVKGFLTAFQRYLFTKTMLPTDVEFSLLDTFDILDSQWRRLATGGGGSRGQQQQQQADASAGKETGFPRFLSWLEAHNATVAIEESEALFEQQQRAKLAAGGATGGGGGGGSLRDDDSASMLEEEEDEEDDGSLSLRSAKDNSVGESLEGDNMDHEEDDDHSHSSSEEEEDDDDEDSESEGGTETEEEEEFDEEAYMRQLEEEAFERELRRVTMDALERGKNVSRKIVADYMPVGTQVINKKKQQQPSDSTKASGEASSSEQQPSGGGGPGIALGGKTGISFQVLRKGNKGKVEAAELIVPSDTNLAMVATKQDDEAARERDVIKQRVLQYEADSAEAEYAGGNVYLEQEKLQVIRNRPLSMAEIDKNFGTTGGNLLPQDRPRSSHPGPGGRGSYPGGGPGGRGGRAAHGGLRGPGGIGGRAGGRSSGRGGRGRGRSSSSGRTLF